MTFYHPSILTPTNVKRYEIGCFPSTADPKLEEELTITFNKTYQSLNKNKELSYEKIFKKAIQETMKEKITDSAAFYLQISWEYLTHDRLDVYLGSIGKVCFSERTLENFSSIHEYILKETEAHKLTIENKQYSTYDTVIISRKSILH